jgi:hypothetical protein
MGQRRFTRLTNGFSKKLDNHVAAVALYVAHYNLCRVHEALRTTPAKALGVADRAWSIAQLVDAALAVAPALPTETPPDRRRKFTVIEGGREYEPNKPLPGNAFCPRFGSKGASARTASSSRRLEGL